MSEPTHQFVVQFPEDAFADFDALVQFEDTLIDALGDQHDVDGHDIRSGEVNFFVFTGDPCDALAMIRKLTGQRLVPPGMRVASRTVDGEDYEVMWPEGDRRPFEVI